MLALVDEDEMRSSTRVLRQVPSRRASQAATKTAGNMSSGVVTSSGRLGKKSHIDDLDSSSDSSDVSFRTATYFSLVACIQYNTEVRII